MKFWCLRGMPAHFVPMRAVFSHFVCRGAAGGRPEPVSCNKSERTVYSGKTRALHGTHITTGNACGHPFPICVPWRRLWKIRSIGTAWMNTTAVHDVIGTRCDPYTGNLLSGDQYHHCCHSNLTRAMADHMQGRFRMQKCMCMMF